MSLDGKERTFRKFCLTQGLVHLSHSPSIPLYWLKVSYTAIGLVFGHPCIQIYGLGWGEGFEKGGPSLLCVGSPLQECEEPDECAKQRPEVFYRPVW